MTQQWNASVQHQVGTWMLDVTYAANKGNHFAGSGYDLNQVDPDGATALVIAFLVLGPVWAAWWPARARRLARKQAAAVYREGPNPMYDGTHVLRLDEGDLVAIAPGAESRLPFTSVQRVVDTPDYLFVHVGAIQAFVVPRRRVARGDVRAFAEQLRRRLTQRSP